MKRIRQATKCQKCKHRSVKVCVLLKDQLKSSKTTSRIQPEIQLGMSQKCCYCRQQKYANVVKLIPQLHNSQRWLPWRFTRWNLSTNHVEKKWIHVKELHSTWTDAEEASDQNIKIWHDALNTISGSSKSSNSQHLQNQTSHLGCPTRPCHRTVNDIQTAKGGIRAVGSYWFTVYTGKCKLSWVIPMTEHKIWCLLFGCPFLSHLCWMWLCPGRWVKSWFLRPKMFGFRMLLRIKVVRCANENPKYTVH